MLQLSDWRGLLLGLVESDPTNGKHGVSLKAPWRRIGSDLVDLLNASLNIGQLRLQSKQVREATTSDLSFSTWKGGHRLQHIRGMLSWSC